MNLQHDRITELSQNLKLERIGSDWPHLAPQAADREESFADFLESYSWQRPMLVPNAPGRPCSRWRPCRR